MARRNSPVRWKCSPTVDSCRTSATCSRCSALNGARSGDFTYPVGGYDPRRLPRTLDHAYDSTRLRLNLITEVGTPPIIDPIPDVEVDEGQTVNFTATVTEAEPPEPALPSRWSMVLRSARRLT